MYRHRRISSRKSKIPVSVSVSVGSENALTRQISASLSSMYKEQLQIDRNQSQPIDTTSH